MHVDFLSPHIDCLFLTAFRGKDVVMQGLNSCCLGDIPYFWGEGSYIIKLTSHQKTVSPVFDKGCRLYSFGVGAGAGSEASLCKAYKRIRAL